MSMNPDSGKIIDTGCLLYRPQPAARMFTLAQCYLVCPPICHVLVFPGFWVDNFFYLSHVVHFYDDIYFNIGIW